MIIVIVIISIVVLHSLYMFLPHLVDFICLSGMLQHRMRDLHKLGFVRILAIIYMRLFVEVVIECRKLRPIVFAQDALRFICCVCLSEPVWQLVTVT